MCTGRFRSNYVSDYLAHSRRPCPREVIAPDGGSGPTAAATVPTTTHAASLTSDPRVPPFTLTTTKAPRWITGYTAPPAAAARQIVDEWVAVGAVVAGLIMVDTLSSIWQISLALWTRIRSACAFNRSSPTPSS